jgi:peptidoglycan/xylan/chitin deacetylase (PgdA/CDA1 family)
MTRLSELASMLDCSLLRYVLNARPWHWRPYLTLADATDRLASEHGRYAEAIVRLLHERRFSLGAFSFPTEFAHYNDLSLEYLAPRMLKDQRHLAATAKDVLSEMALVGDHEAYELVEALLVSLRRYYGLMELLLAADRLAAPSVVPKDYAQFGMSRSSVTKKHVNPAYMQPLTAA